MEFVLHHVGIVVPDLEQATRRYTQLYGYKAIRSVVRDPVQTASVQFLRLDDAQDLIELVAPLDSESRLQGALAANRRLNHLCYSVPELDGTCERLRSEGLFIIQRPVVAAAFAPRRIAWLMDRDGIPIELVERGEDFREPL